MKNYSINPFFPKETLENMEDVFKPLFRENANEFKINIGEAIPEVSNSNAISICTGIIEILLRLNSFFTNCTTHLTCLYHRDHFIIDISHFIGNLATIGVNNKQAFDPDESEARGLLNMFQKELQQTLQDYLPERPLFRLEEAQIDISIRLNYPGKLIKKSIPEILYRKWSANQDENPELMVLMHKYFESLPQDLRILKEQIETWADQELKEHIHRIKGFPGGFQMKELYEIFEGLSKTLKKSPINYSAIWAYYLTLQSIADKLINCGFIKKQLETSNKLEKQIRIESNEHPVLLADDNQISCELISFYLEKMNIGCLTVGNGLAALRALEEKRFKILLLDFQMPVLDGLETTKRIRSNNQYDHLVIIGLTSDDTTIDKNELIKLGFNHFLTKPLIENELKSLIGKYIEI